MTRTILGLPRIRLTGNTLEQEQGLATLTTNTEQVAKAKVDTILQLLLGALDNRI